MDTLQPLTANGQVLDAKRVAFSEAPLIVHIDFKSPYAFLAIEPTRRMLAALGVVADWRPFVLDIGSYLGTAKLAKDGKVAKQNRSAEQWSGVKYAYFDCRRYANLSNQTIRGTVKIWNTNLPAIGMWWIKRHEDLASQNRVNGLLQRFIDSVYLPFWQREFDAEDLHAVYGVLEQIGAPTEGFLEFAQTEGAAFNDVAQKRTFDSGVYGVPTYQLLGHSDHTGEPAKFFGREHLPRISSMLSNQVDDLPDAAYSLAADVEASALEKSASKPGITQEQNQLAVLFDFKSPNSYLALSALLVAKQQGIKLTWHPFDHKPLKQPARFVADEDRSTRHRRVRGEYIAADIQRYAPHPLQDIYLETDCSVANMGLLWLRDTAPSRVDGYVQKTFVSIWYDETDITDVSAVTELLRASVGGIAFDENAWLEYVQNQGQKDLVSAYERAVAQGVSYAPTMFLGDEPFQGRAQLPLVIARLRAGI